MKNKVLMNRLVILSTVIVSVLLALFNLLGTVNVYWLTSFHHNNSLIFLIKNFFQIFGEKILYGYRYRAPVIVAFVTTIIPVLVSVIFLVIKLVNLSKLNSELEGWENDRIGLKQVKLLVIESFIYATFLAITYQLGKLTVFGYIIFIICFLIIVGYFLLLFHFQITPMTLAHSLIMLSFLLIIFSITLRNSAYEITEISEITGEDFVSPYLIRSLETGNSNRRVYKNPFNLLEIAVPILSIFTCFYCVLYSFILLKHVPYMKNKTEGSAGLIAATSIMIFLNLMTGLMGLISSIKLQHDETFLNPISAIGYIFSFILMLMGSVSLLTLILYKGKQKYCLLSSD